MKHACGHSESLHAAAHDTRQRGAGLGLLGWALSGFVLWFVLLCLLYALHAMACDVNWPHARVVSTLAVALAIGLAIMGAMVLRQPWRDSPVRFARALVGHALLAAALASALTLAPALLLSPCGL